MDSKKYWVGFNLVKGVGAVRLRAILDYFGRLDTAWLAPADALRAAGLSQKVVENLVQLRKQVNLDLVMERAERQGVIILTWEDDQYPARLRQVDQPPPVLYLRGDFLDEDHFAVAVVGTRRVTPYGRQVADELGGFLARHGITVVSGLARGVDAIAHDAALKAGGRTIAVLGSGVDHIYPPEHRALAERIVKSGALASDYAPGTPPDGVNFPPRNRIISGLSQATVVVEAGEKSGALITATFAAEQGREVFAVPGSIYAAQSKGTNALIRDGARPLLAMDEILEVLQLGRVEEKQAARRHLPADATETMLLGYLSREPVHIDEIVGMSGLPIDRVSATLTMMELKGMVRPVGGMNYVSVQENRVVYTVSDDENDES